MLKSFIRTFIVCLLLLFCNAICFAQARGKGHTDTATKKIPLQDTTGKKNKVPKPPYVHQFRLGFDISRIAFNLMYPSRQGYELQADYALRGKLYAAAETGFGRGKINYTNLKYTTNSYFVRLGIDQSVLDRIGPLDFDMAFIGVRYGMSIGNRSDATYLVPSLFGPPDSGSVAGQSFVAHWGEIVGGVKVELGKGIFAGWNFRGKFLVNAGSFKELAPNYIAGYGKGDKSTVFDFNFYISYAIRWNKKAAAAAAAALTK
jgi:hypothetical protein